MNKHLSICLFIALILALTGCTEPADIPQSDTPSSTITSKDTNPSNDISTANIEHTISELSSEKYAGRLTGTTGNNLAVDYIADYFASTGIESADFASNYRQDYTQTVFLMNSTPKLSLLDEYGSTAKEYEFLDDFTNAVMDGVSLKNEKVLEMVIADDASFFKDRQKDLSGKALLISSEIRGIIESDEIYSFCKNTGTEGLVLEETEYQDYVYGHLIRYSSLYRYTGDNPNGFMFYLVEQDIFKDLSDSKDKNFKIHMESDYEARSSNASNIAAMIPGKKTSTNLVISAHMDHVGDNLNGTYNPGALDNASGTATVMELARYFSSIDQEPDINLYFVLFNGEEENLYGSTYLARNSNFTSDNTTVINMDMVGSKEALPLTLLSSYPHSEKLQDELADFADDLGMETQYSNEGASDNLPFEMKGIPSVTLIHEDMDGIHYPGDTLDNMDVNRTAEIAVFLAEFILETAY
ncbi:Peptidase family M28 [Dethiosulfatibacter aminovorans DSM 17477]|uniref:Peptidase family M28 n=1 Tax=Dethiosulfatibacter aminovorans DSM 17477 TaxID=1121476 RepID=A0A1M6F8P0_9FIRM|nr:M28 family metallopeptidase [Dethiosulfatibacter aminovorans]SHI94067.1 Peptidase family M28 [Dethiosulfatibacter aminovorans DSM 17477]